MSKYRRIRTIFSDESALAAAIQEVCAERKAEFEADRGNALHLYGYHGDRRPETATYVVRRNHISGASNDLGFARKEDGTFEAIVSEFDMSSERYGLGWLHRITERYNYHALNNKAWSLGYSVQESLDDEGRTVLNLVKAF